MYEADVVTNIHVIEIFRAVTKRQPTINEQETMIASYYQGLHLPTIAEALNEDCGHDDEWDDDVGGDLAITDVM